MRKINSLLIILVIASQCMAQQKEKPEEREDVSERKNIVKINLPALAFKNISLQYERQIGRKTSVGVNVHTIAFGKLPFQSTFKSLTDNSDVQYDQFKLGSFGVVLNLDIILVKMHFMVFI